MKKTLPYLIFLIITTFATPSIAADAGQIVKDALNAYAPLQNKWHDAILPFTYNLFWLLVLLDVTYSSMQHVIERKTLEDTVGWITRKFITVLFFFTLIKMSGEWIPQIIDSFELIGKTAANTPNLTPDGIIEKGYNLSLALFTQLGELGIEDQIIFAIPVLFTAIFLLLGFAVIAGQLLITLIESYIVIGAGIIMLGFSGSKWTSDMATSYLKYAVGTGVKLMLAFLIIGAGLSVFSKMSIDPDQFINSVFGLILQTAIFIFLSWNIPSLASAMMSGSPSSTLGGALGVATSAAAAVAGTAAMTKDAGAATYGGAKNLGSKGLDFASSFGSGRSNSIENSSGSSGMPSSAIPDPNGPPPGGDGNASNASIGSNKVSAETQAKLDKIYPKNANGKSETDKDKTPKQPSTSLHQKIKNAGSLVPNDQATVQTSGFNLTHGKE